MTRKHFNVIAQEIQKAHDFTIDGPKESVNTAITRLSEALAEQFKTFNPNFDTKRFLDACDASRLGWALSRKEGAA